MAQYTGDFIEIHASGAIPSAETSTLAINCKGSDAINLILDVLGGGFNAVQIRPEFSFDSVKTDANGVNIAPTVANQEWFGGTVGVWDSSLSISNIKDDLSHHTVPSGTITKRIVTFDNPGAAAARFLFNGSGLVGPDPGAIRIRIAEINTIYTGKSIT
tara:strand:- start:10262 stop:10738 length:477 start_codon:yes stop_codon:yes gene_type:complete